MIKMALDYLLERENVLRLLPALVVLRHRSVAAAVTRYLCDSLGSQGHSRGLVALQLQADYSAEQRLACYRSVERGDTLRNPVFTDPSSGGLATFDVVVANPPFSLEQWGREIWENDPWAEHLRVCQPIRAATLLGFSTW